jgi:hypothetical protein
LELIPLNRNFEPVTFVLEESEEDEESITKIIDKGLGVPSK